MRAIFYIIVFSLFSNVLLCQQDTAIKLLKDQNPNYLKSKIKYEVIPVDTSKKTITPKKDSLVTIPIKTNVPVVVSQESELDGYLSKLQQAQLKKDLKIEQELLSIIGDYHLKKDNLKEAQLYYEKALIQSSKLRNDFYTIKNNYNIGLVLLRKKDYTLSESFFQKAISLAKKNKNDEFVKLISSDLSKLYVKQGNYKNAYEMHLLFQQTTDSLYKLETKRSIEQQNTKMIFAKMQLTDSLKLVNVKANYQLDIDNKQQEIDNKRMLIYISLTTLLFISVAAYLIYRNYKTAKLSRDLISEQKKQVEDKKNIIEKSLTEKEILLKEIHHRVKNNLQIISSLLNMQSNRVEDESLKKIMIEAKNRISSMSLIHQNIYQSGNLSTIDFADYISQLVKSIEKTINNQSIKINYLINSNNITMNMDTAIPIGLIINELITNTFKYAFKNKETGNISIQLKQLKDGKLALHYSDDGVGIPEGFDINASKSLGLKLVKGLVEQLKGSLKVENNNGAHFNIIFTAKE